MKIFKVLLPWNRSSGLLPFSKTLHNRKVIISIIITILICIIAYYSIQSVFDPSSRTESNIEKFPLNRLAVLPLNNYSPDIDDNYISDGFTEEIIAVLSKIQNLQVIARTSVMKYKNINTDINQVAHDLLFKHRIIGTIQCPFKTGHGTFIFFRAEIDTTKGVVDST